MAIAFSNTGKNTATPTTGNTLSVTVTVNAGDTVVVEICGDNSISGLTRTITSVTDTGPGGNTYTQQINKSNAAGCQTYIWASLNVANAATSVTVNISGAFAQLNITVTTYTGVGSNGFGNTNTNSATSGTLTVAVTTQDANNFVVACFGQTAVAAITFTASVGNLRNQEPSAVSAVAANDNTAASASSVTNTVTSNRSAASWAACAVELRSTNIAAFTPDEDFSPRLAMTGAEPQITVWQ